MMILRLVELGIAGSPQRCMEIYADQAVIAPVADIVIFPELFTTGFVLDRIPKLALSTEDLPGLPFSELSRMHGIWIVAGTLPVSAERGITNTMVVYGPDGGIAYTTEKVHLFKQMGEDAAFVPGKCGGVFRMGEGVAGGIICYDLRFPELTRRLTLAGAEFVFVPAQWPSGRRQLFRSLLRARAAESQVFVAGCNLGGEHLGVSFLGGGGVAHPSGNLLKGIDVAEGVTDFEFDITDVLQMRRKIDCLRDLRPEEYVPTGGAVISDE